MTREGSRSRAGGGGGGGGGAIGGSSGKGFDTTVGKSDVGNS